LTIKHRTTTNTSQIRTTTSQLSARLSGHHLIIKYYDQRVRLFPQKIIKVELYEI